MRVFLDTNVILDLFLGRIPFADDASAIWEANARGEHKVYVSGITLVNLAYSGRKVLGAQAARQAVTEYLAAAQLAPVDDVVVQLAHASGMADSEDAVQHASAVAASADVIVTRDPKGFVGATLPVLSPADFRARYLSQTDTSAEP